jgi:uncharacterized protein (DUF1684 family)
MSLMPGTDFATLADYRRQVMDMYAWVRSSELPGQKVWDGYRQRRDTLIGQHHQSPLDVEQRSNFEGLPYFPYAPQLRFSLTPDFEVEPVRYLIELGEDGPTAIERFARVSFSVAGQAATLDLYWISGYGGGVFLPFRDATNSKNTYGGGRYLLDTIKGADLGRSGEAWILDFNYAYNPSCAYNSRWVCPLAPGENRLAVPIKAGELAYPDPR